MAQALRVEGHDVLRATEVGQARADDEGERLKEKGERIKAKG